MANCTINSYLNGYPDSVGNKKRVVVILNGPSLYVAGGIGIPQLAHVKNIHQVLASINNETYEVIPRIHGVKPVGLFSDVKLMFIVLATGAEAGGIDLSATKVRLVVEGTN